MKRRGRKPKSEVKKADQKHVEHRRVVVQKRAAGQHEGMTPGQIARHNQTALNQANKSRRRALGL